MDADDAQTKSQNTYMSGCVCTIACECVHVLSFAAIKLTRSNLERKRSISLYTSRHQLISEGRMEDSFQVSCYSTRRVPLLFGNRCNVSLISSHSSHIQVEVFLTA